MPPLPDRDAADLDGCTIVVAHPDDELLWAGSLVDRAAAILVCYGDVPGNPAIGAGRRALAARLDLGNAHFLLLPEPGSFDRALWPDPEETAFGLRLRAAPARARAYRQSFGALAAALRPRLAGAGVVVTHNPWGEYGHEDHVQVLRVVEALQPALGFRIFVSCYAGPKAAGLMARNLGRLGAATPELAIDPDRMASLRQTYLDTGTWTWRADYRWPETERFFALRPPGAPAQPGAHHRLTLIEQAFRPQPLWQREIARYRSALARRLGLEVAGNRG
ncbi:hypothetical protein [Thermaurantiacus sp.]